jgi:ABC-type polysaccharide/polyol phosphate transport system ATPase subunit
MININIAIKLENINKTFLKHNQKNNLREIFLPKTKSKIKLKKHFKALSDINLTINKGECIGIIGRNGSGKSTLLHIIMRNIRPDKGGSVHTQGKIMRLTLGMGVDRNLSARDNIYVNGSILGLSFKRIGTIFEDIINFSGLNDFVDTPVKFYSKGMRQRLLFAIAMYAEADIFLLDEFFGGVGDKDYKAKSDRSFEEKILQGKTIVIVSHNTSIIKKYAQRTIWLNQGEIYDAGDTDKVVSNYLSHKKATVKKHDNK